MEIFKSNRLFCNFYPTLPKTFFILKVSKRAPFKYPRWRLSGQMESGAFVKVILTDKKTSQRRRKNFLILDSKTP